MARRCFELTQELEDALRVALAPLHPDVDHILSEPKLVSRFLVDFVRAGEPLAPHTEAVGSLGQVFEEGNTALQSGLLLSAFRSFRRGLAVAESKRDLGWSARFNAAIANIDDSLRIRGDGLAEGRALDRRRAAYEALVAIGEESSELALRLHRLLQRDAQFPIVFLSYDSAARDFVLPVASRLAQHVRVKMDVLTFRSGVSLNRQIDVALHVATTVVFFLTPRFLRRPYCIKELLGAVQRVDSLSYAAPRFIVTWMDQMGQVPKSLSDQRLLVQAGRSADEVADELLRDILSK